MPLLHAVRHSRMITLVQLNSDLWNACIQVSPAEVELNWPTLNQADTPRKGKKTQNLSACELASQFNGDISSRGTPLSRCDVIAEALITPLVGQHSRNYMCTVLSKVLYCSVVVAHFFTHFTNPVRYCQETRWMPTGKGTSHHPASQRWTHFVQ